MAKHNSLEGFKKALRSALELHDQYPKCKPSLEGKKSWKPGWKTPEVIPENKGHYKRLTTDRRGCLCCHCVQSGEILAKRKLKIPLDDGQLWVFPMPDLLGLHFDRLEKATVRSVDAGSVGENAGFQKGDRVLTVEKQPIISIADVQWVLHSARDGAKIKVKVDRGGKKTDLTLPLLKGWRRKRGFAWRRSTWPLRQRILGLVLETLPDDERDRIGVSEGALALRIKNVTPANVKKSNSSARSIGLRKGDVIIGVDGKTKPMTESDLLGYVFQKKPPGSKLTLKVHRGGKTKRFQLTVQ
jgi:S1-C subfamily serine protease